MTKRFRLKIRTPDQEIMNQDVDSIHLRTINGELMIFAQHASLIGNILFTKLTVTMENETKEYLVQKGVIFVKHELNTVTILCYSCKLAQVTSFKDTEEYLQYIETQLQQHSATLNTIQLKYLKDQKIAVTEELKEIKKSELIK